jgi:hypothetical protein
MTEATTCQEITGSGRGRVQFICGGVIKDEGLCARHLAGKRRSEKVAQQKAEERQRWSEELNESGAVAKELTALGFPAWSDRKYVRMPRHVAEELIERLKESS